MQSPQSGSTTGNSVCSIRYVGRDIDAQRAGRGCSPPCRCWWLTSSTHTSHSSLPSSNRLQSLQWGISGVWCIPGGIQLTSCKRHLRFNIDEPPRGSLPPFTWGIFALTFQGMHRVDTSVQEHPRTTRLPYQINSTKDLSPFGRRLFGF